MMDFDDRDKVAQMIARNGTMFQKLSMFQQLALALTQKYEPERTAELVAAITGQQSMMPNGKAAEKNASAEKALGEDTRVTKARAQSRQASQVEG